MQHAASAVSMSGMSSPPRAVAAGMSSPPRPAEEERRRKDIQSINQSFNQSMLINTHITPPNHFVQQRQGAILARGIILKSDSFPTEVPSSIKAPVSQSINQSLDVHLLGAPNMRQVRPFPLFGLGQPTMSGIRAMLNFLKAKQSVDKSSPQPPVLESSLSISSPQPISQSASQPSRVVHWIMTREEPIIYLNNRPFVLRELSTPYHNLLDFSGIDVDRLDMIEMRLKEEILIEARCNDGNFLVHDEQSNGEVRACFESVSEDSIRTSREVFQQLTAEGYQCELRRVPITAESVMAPKQFDEIVAAIKKSRNMSSDLSKPPMFHASSMPPLQSSLSQSSHPLQILVFNCQLGRGRSTLATVIAFLYNCHTLAIEPEVVAPNAAQQALKHDEHDGMSAFHSGEWDVILKLVRMLHNGRRAKLSVDCAIDACGHVHNVRETIVRAFMKAERSRGVTQRAEFAEEMAAALKRYFWLICFQSWLIDQPLVQTTDVQSTESFQRFVNQHPELSVLASSFISPDSIVELLPETVATPETINQLASECHPLDTAVFARSAPVLSRFSIVKSEFFAPQGRHRSVELSAIMKNYRSLHELHISATAQPNVAGIRTILNDLRNHQLLPVVPSSHHQHSPNNQVIMINLREEPVLFLCHEPFLLRDWRHPFQILPEFTTGVTANRIEQIETALKSDILNEILQNKQQAAQRHSPLPIEEQSRLLIHEESSERQIEPRYLSLQPEDVLTNRQVFEQLRKEGYKLDYHRVPLHAEEAPSARSIERLFNLLNSHHHDQLVGVDISVVFVDQTGGHRCTIGMIIACLVMEHQGTLDLRVHPDGRASPSHEMLRQISVDSDVSALSSSSPRSQVPAVIITDHSHLEPSIVIPQPSSPAVDELAVPQLKRVSSTIISVNETSRDDERATNGRGEFKAILSLIRILKRGRAMKEEVDLCIDVCGRVHNLRESISEKVRLYDVNRSGQTNKAELLAAAKLLESYALLIAFNAYLHERSEAREEALHLSFNLAATTATDDERQSSASENVDDSSEEDEESVNDPEQQREALLRNEDIDAAGLANYNAFNPYAGKSNKDVDGILIEEGKVDDEIDRAISASPTSDADQSTNQSTSQSINQARKSSMFAVSSPTSSPVLTGRSVQPDFTFPAFTQWLHARPELRLAVEFIRHEPEEALKLNQMAVDEKFARAFDRRDGNVLVRGSLLKSDHFVGVVNKNVHQLLEGAINFRPIDAFPVAGTGIPTAEGIARIVDFYLQLNASEQSTNQSVNQFMDPVTAPVPPFKADSLVWMNLREEPILYVNGRPFVVRDADNPYSNLENTGITPRRVEAMERMLKRDALHEARKSGSKCVLLLHDEDASGNMFAYMERVDENSLKTPREQFEAVFDQVRVQLQARAVNQSISQSIDSSPFPLKYYRTPITDEQAPSPAAFDAMIRLLEDGRSEAHRAIIANCQMGRGRTTTGLIIACLWSIQRGRFDSNKFSLTNQSTKQFISYEPAIPGHEPVNQSHVSGMSDALLTRLKDGWFKVITLLVRVLPNGQAIKAQVDRVIDECADMQNLRLVCAEQQITALTCLPRKRAFFVRRGTNYLIRYFFLVLFNAYLNEEHANDFKVKFVEWINKRQEALNLLKRIDFPEIDQPIENTD